MTIIIIHGGVGSGKTSKALEILPDDYILYNDSVSPGDLQINRTIFVDDADKLKSDELKKIIKYTKGDLVLTCTDLGKIDKGTKDKAKKINLGNIDKRNKLIREKYPHSSLTGNYDGNIFKVLEHIYSNPDRKYVNEMLNNLKPNVYSLMIWMLENGNLDLLQYIDKEQLFKSKPQFLYSTIAYGIEPKPRRIQWPKKLPSEKVDEELKKHFGLRSSDVRILKNILKVEKVVKPKTTKIKSVPKAVKPKSIQTGFDKW